jgi:hypothetical protein
MPQRRKSEARVRVARLFCVQASHKDADRVRMGLLDTEAAREMLAAA